ncbi:MAG: hypothetical protein IJJ20_01880 [Thermoguttaceae bacterium]|nr:hypothetical protein [Thermoguttaceae bacterium]
MTNHPFRFIHAADLHLDLPVTGLSHLPEHLREKVLSAPREAAERLFKEALAERVDFVLLAGGVLDPSKTGAWGPLFLLDQFEKLRLEGIQVFWACGVDDDPSNWPDVFPLPENVHRFPVDEIEEVIFRKEGVPHARILGTSLGKGQTVVNPSGYLADPDGLYSIGLFYGKPALESLKAAGMQYWALGGSPVRETLSQTPAVIHYPGVTLARSAADRGDCGCSLVEVNEFGRTVIRPIRTTPIAWASERVTVRTETLEEDALLNEMRLRLRAHRKAQDDGTLLFVNWLVELPVDQIGELRYGNLVPALLRDLRGDFGKEEPVIYSIDIEPAVPETLDLSLYDQQTILGDFLRITHFYRENPDQPIALSDFFPEDVREYLENRLLIEKVKARNEARAAGGESDNTLPEELPEDRHFRPEIPEIVRLLSLSIDEQEGFRKTFNDLKERRTGEWLKRIAYLRGEALKEAAVLGTELLTGQSEEVRRQAAPAILKDPRIEQERRGALDYNERKEN